MTAGQDPPPGTGAGAGGRHEGLRSVPGMREDPLVWDHRVGGFVPAASSSRPDADPYGAPPGAGADPASSGGDPTAAFRMADDPTSASPAPGPGGPGDPGGSLSSGGRRHVVINAGEQARRPGSDRMTPGPAGPAPPAPGLAPAPVAPPRPLEPAPYPGPRPAPARRPRRRRRIGPRRLLGALVSIPLVLALLLVAFAYQRFEQIPRAPVSESLSSGASAGTNWLIVGSDSREGTAEDDPVNGPGVLGQRTDSIMILRNEGGKQSLLSIPRDLWVKDPTTGEMGRINGTFNNGPANLIDAVKGLGIPVHRYLEINFVGFGQLVDAVGGIDIEFPFPARDTHSGLFVPEAGVQRLDGAQALAYVRSRFYEELKDGRWVQDPLSDLSRVQRQRTFLTALMGKVSGTKNPFKLFGIMDAMGGGLRLDDDLNLFGAIGLALGLRGFSPESATLPTVNATRGGAAVLDLDQAKAPPVIEQYAA